MVFNLENGKHCTNTDRRIIKEAVKKYKPKVIYIAGLELWKEFQLEEYGTTLYGTRSGWRTKKSGNDNIFGDSEVFVGKTWSTSADNQKPLWEHFGSRVAQLRQSETKETSATPPPLSNVEVTPPRKRQAPDHSIACRVEKRLK